MSIISWPRNTRGQNLINVVRTKIFLGITHKLCITRSEVREQMYFKFLAIFPIFKVKNSRKCEGGLQWASQSQVTFDLLTITQ